MRGQERGWGQAWEVGGEEGRRGDEGIGRRGGEEKREREEGMGGEKGRIREERNRW